MDVEYHEVSKASCCVLKFSVLDLRSDCVDDIVMTFHQSNSLLVVDLNQSKRKEKETA